MDDGKIATLAENFYARLAQLGKEFEDKIKEVRDDALRSAIEEMGASVNRRLTSIEERLKALEDTED